MASEKSPQLRIVEGFFRGLAKSYIVIHRPKIVVTAGSVGKTSTKLTLAKLLASEKNISFMDDSYNYGLGLYLSVFECKVPDYMTLSAWFKTTVQALGHFFVHRDVLLLEYGIDHPGDMDKLVAFARPHTAVLTAVTPEHMEYLQTIDTVGEEEIKVIAACRDFGVVNTADVDEKYLSDLKTKWYSYGSIGADAHYEVEERTAEYTVITIIIGDVIFKSLKVPVIADALIRQTTGAVLMAHKLGISVGAIEKTIPTIMPAASRMHPLKGVNNSLLIDDSANFSPVAGVEALKTLKSLPATRRIAILGNMHELGDFIEEGYADVGKEFDGINIMVLVGELSHEHFGRIAEEKGFKEGEMLFYFDTSIQAGLYVRDHLAKDGDVILIKGPFGGYYLEEAAKKLLASPEDVKYLTRQSTFWDHKKRALFGDTYDA